MTSARLGGDEFAVLLCDVVPDRAAAIARSLLDEVRAGRFPLEDGHQLRLSVSIGITTFDGADALSPAELLVNADIAMYDAKEAGRDRVALAAADVHQERVKSRQSWLERIHVALEHERSGVIRDIDHWVIRSACRMIAEAHARGESLPSSRSTSPVSP